MLHRIRVCGAKVCNLVALYIVFAWMPGLLPSAVGQASTAVIGGTIMDASEAVIPQASITAENTATGTTRKTVSNRSGQFVLPSLDPGHYALRVEKNGFATSEVQGIDLNVGANVSLSIKLKVGSEGQTVTVDGSGIQLNTTDGSVSTVVDRQFVANLPLNGRSFQDLISMTPGVSTQSPQINYSKPGNVGDFSVNGQRTESNYYTVDGVSANSNTGAALGGGGPANGGLLAASSALGTTQTLLSVDALQEFRVNSSTYSAEYGRSPGGQISLLSRSGTNDLHGTVFDYLRNGWFDANDWFNDRLGQPKQELHQNDFGVTLGGPLWIPGLYKGTNKTFFFGSYEGLRLTQPTAASVQYVPDVYMREQAPPQLQPLLNAFPKQSLTGIDYGTAQSPSLAQFFQGYSLPGSIDSTSFRLDQVFTPRFSSFFRFGYNPSSIQSRALSSLTSSEITSTSYTFGSTYALSSLVTDEFRLGYTRGNSINHATLDSFGGAIPVSLGSAMNVLAATDGNPEVALSISGVGSSNITTQNTENIGRQWNLTDSVVLTHNNHQIKIGVDYRRITSTIDNPATVSGAFYSSAQQVLNNASYEAYIERFLNSASIYNQIAAFAQDEWKLNTRVSVSLGVRWELDPPPHSGNNTKPSIVLGDLTQPASLSLSAPGNPLWKTPWWNFAPRLGIAWQLHNTPNRETVFRAGGGLFFDTDNEAAIGAFEDVGYSTAKIFTGAIPMPFSAAQNDFSVTVIPPYSQAAYYPSHLQLPYTLEWSAGVEQALGQAQTFSVTYVASAGRRLIQQQELSLTKTPFQTIYYYPGGGVNSNYQSLQAKFQRRMTNGLTALVSYTWSHSLDYGSNYSSLPLTRGNSDFDLRNNFQTGLTWDIPTPHSNNVLRDLFGGWGMDGRLLARTAFPVTLRGSYTVDPLTGSVYYTNVNLIADQPLYLYGSQYPGGRVLNKAAFQLPTAPNPGDAPRNFVRAFGANQVNFAIHRHFPLGDRFGLQFRAEAFNILNHPNFGYVDPTLSDATFGQATQTLNQSLGTVASQYQQGGPRSMQFALKLQF